MYNDGSDFNLSELEDEMNSRKRAYNSINKLWASFAFVIAVFTIAMMFLGFAISTGSKIGLTVMNDAIGTDHANTVIQLVGNKKVKRVENKLVEAKNDGDTLAHDN